MRITKLDDLVIYQESILLTKEVFTLCKCPKLKTEYSLQDQIKRACVSVSANIAEGYGRRTKADFSQFLSISLGSCNEAIALLDVIKLNFPTLETTELKGKYQILSKRIYSFRSYQIK
ncbi:MAG TPA: four helix bundle protein [Patescibacteria group bacterium]|nr:four helix bundle protein [Patescibacteria group bacterium]